MARTTAKTTTARKPKAKTTTARKPKAKTASGSVKTNSGAKSSGKTSSRSAKSNKLTMQQQAEQILKQAEEKGISQNFFFSTTFKRYMVQLDIMTDLEKSIKEHGATVTKEYVKGRENLVANPAITEFNKTATAANGTVSTLINILKSLTDEPDKKDALTEFLNG